MRLPKEGVYFPLRNRYQRDNCTLEGRDEFAKQLEPGGQLEDGYTGDDEPENHEPESRPMDDVADLFGDDEEPDGAGGEPLPPTPPAEEVDPCAPHFAGYRKDRNDKSYPVDQYGTRWFGDRSKQQRSRPRLADPGRWYGPGSAEYRRSWKEDADTAAAVTRESIIEFDDFDGMKHI